MKKVKSKANKLIKAPKGKSLEDLKQAYIQEGIHPAEKKLLFFLIRKLDEKFKG
mgnify:CR=1 FL=1